MTKQKNIGQTASPQKQEKCKTHFPSHNQILHYTCFFANPTNRYERKKSKLLFTYKKVFLFVFITIFTFFLVTTSIAQTLNEYKITFFGQCDNESPKSIINLDNNQDILLLCKNGKTFNQIKNKGVEFTQSQIKLMLNWRLLNIKNDTLITNFPIIDSTDNTKYLKDVSHKLALQIAPDLQKDILLLKRELKLRGYEKNIYSILFSYILDDLPWKTFENNELIKKMDISVENPFWNGRIWAVYPPRKFQCGTNLCKDKGVTIYINWSNSGSKKVWELYRDKEAFLELFNAIIEKNKLSEKTIRIFETFGIVSSTGELTVPVIIENNDNTLYKICKKMSDKIASQISKNLDIEYVRKTLNLRDTTDVILIVYHEFMWDLIEYFEDSGLIQKPIAFADPQKTEMKDIRYLFFVVKNKKSDKSDLDKKPIKKDIFQQYLKETREKYNIPGLAAIVVSGKSILNIGVDGVRNIEKQDKIQLNDRFHIGSNTKAITGFIIGILVEKGLIDWETKVFDIFPELKSTSNPAFYNITLKDLLSHRAKIHPFTDGREFEALPEFKGSKTDKRKFFTAWLLKQKSVEIDSTKGFTYSNAGYSIAAAMIEKITKKSWEENIKELFFTSIKIDGGFDWSAVLDERQPWGHIIRNDTIFPHNPNGKYHINDLISPAGNINMAINDYAKFLQINLLGINGNDTILKSETYNFLHYCNIDSSSYAIGWKVIKEDGKTISAHDGSAGTFYCHTYLIKEQDIAVTVMANIATNDAVKGIYELRGKIISEIKKVTD